MPGVRNQNTRLVYRGGVPKRPTGADCKSAGLRLRRFESFPLHQLTVEEEGTPAVEVAVDAERHQRGCSSMVEPQPSKLMTWVRFPLPAPALCRCRKLSST